MAGRRKAAAKRKTGGNSLAQFGLMDMPDISALGNIDEDGDDSDENEDGLEEELMALMSGKAPTKARRKPKPQIASLDEISRMADECTKDDISDEDDDADLSGDEDLMAEFNAIVPGSPPSKGNCSAPLPPPRSSSQNSIVDLLQERLSLYHSAEAAAKSAGDISKARRYGRAMKTLEGLVKTAKTGGAVSEEDIPPPVTIPKVKPPERPQAESSVISPEKPFSNQIVPDVHPAPPLPPPRSAPVVQKKTEAVPANPQHTMLCERRDQYKVAALSAKRKGDTQTAIKYVKIAKQFDAVLTALENGQPIDLSKMPPPPPSEQGNTPVAAPPVPAPPQKSACEEEQVQTSNFAMPDPNEFLIHN